MRKTQIPLIAVIALLAACATIQPGNDPVVVRAEQTTQLAYNTFESFKQYEYNNRATLESLEPKIESYANYIRRNEQKWLQSARSLTQAYKYNRNAENKANLDTAIAVLQEAINQVGRYMAAGRGA